MVTGREDGVVLICAFLAGGRGSSPRIARRCRCSFNLLEFGRGNGWNGS
jgi:hypothetical protein